MSRTPRQVPKNMVLRQINSISWNPGSRKAQGGWVLVQGRSEELEREENPADVEKLAAEIDRARQRLPQEG